MLQAHFTVIAYVRAGFHMSHYIVSHHISSEFWAYDQLGLFQAYENQLERYPNSSQVHRKSSQLIRANQKGLFSAMK